MKKLAVIIAAASVLCAVAVLSEEVRFKTVVKKAVSEAVDSIVIAKLNYKVGTRTLTRQTNGLLLDGEGMVAATVAITPNTKFTDIKVRLSNGKEYAAKAVAYEQEYALLFLRLNKEELAGDSVQLKPLDLNSKTPPLEIGDVVFDIGKASENTDYAPHVRFDVVSMLLTTPVEGAQTNFNSNPGRPVYNSDGALVGIRLISAQYRYALLVYPLETLKKAYEKARLQQPPQEDKVDQKDPDGDKDEGEDEDEDEDEDNKKEEGEGR